MLAAAPYIGFIPVRDLDAAREFYEAELGLAVREQSPAMLLVDSGGTTLWITAVGEFSPQPFTIAGWRVVDIEEMVDRLVGQGIAMLHYPGFGQDGRGVWTAPSGNRVVWFNDPDGNVLSLSQFPGAVVDDYWR